MSKKDQSLHLGIMGGTFDPIHMGHLVCAQAALDQLKLDRVVFMPAGNPHFKLGLELADACDRLAMCELACLPNDRFTVSDMEVVREGVTYTVDTVREMRRDSPDIDLTFIIGSDAFLGFPGWKGADELVRELRFAVLMRPGDDRAKVETLAAEVGISYDFVDCPLLDISSTGIRQQVAVGRSVRYLTPDAVCVYIDAHELYRKCAPLTGEANQDALSKKFFRERKRELEDRVSPKRFKHIEGVSETAKKLASAYGVDERKAALAGLLHDWDKGYDDEGIRERVIELGLADVIDPFVIKEMPQVLHGPTAACALVRDYPQIPPDVIRAIYNHTTASTDADDLEKILYIADAIEPTRKFDSVKELRESVGEVSLDELFFRVYKFWTLTLLSRDKILHPHTMLIWNDLAEKQRNARHQ